MRTFEFSFILILKDYSVLFLSIREQVRSTRIYYVNFSPIRANFDHENVAAVAIINYLTL